MRGTDPATPLIRQEQSKAPHQSHSPWTKADKVKHIDPIHDQRPADHRSAIPCQAYKHNRTNTSRAGILMPPAIPLPAKRA